MQYLIILEVYFSHVKLSANSAAVLLAKDAVHHSSSMTCILIPPLIDSASIPVFGFVVLDGSLIGLLAFQYVSYAV